MFIVQPNSSFGDLIREELDCENSGQRQWQIFEFAVAWVNRLGAERIKDSAQNFLADGGCIRATVGLDFGSTSYEGLGSLLDLEGEGDDITTHVFCDENPACTFHPKVFLFSNEERARLFVGSNNMTGAGLDANVEAALGVAGALDDETIREARQTLAAWRDEGNESRTRRLTRELLEKLRDQRYVLTEEEIRNRRNSERASRSTPGEPLFGRSTTRAGARGRGTGGRRFGGGLPSAPGVGEVLLMRVRPRRDGTQLQVSMTVLRAPFMNGAEEVVSAANGSRRGIGYDHVTRNGIRAPNLARFEAPELEGMTNPVARFQWVNAGNSGREADRVLQYEIFDADTGGEGARIFRKLEQGIATPPVTNLEQLSREGTVLSKSDRVSAQWYRLDSA
jgi:hypothetical protein